MSTRNKFSIYILFIIISSHYLSTDAALGTDWIQKAFGKHKKTKRKIGDINKGRSDSFEDDNDIIVPGMNDDNRPESMREKRKHPLQDMMDDDKLIDQLPDEHPMKIEAMKQ
eukprot:338067_1